MTGAHRTGTGWVSKVLAMSPSRLGYIWEPFSPRHRPGTYTAGCERYYQYVCAENCEGYEAPLRDTIDFRYRPLAELRSLRKPRDAGRMLRDWGTFAYRRRRGTAALLKDPIALFSSEWLADGFGLDVVVTIRHPAAFVASLKTRNWRHSFQSFLDQPLLMRDFLHPYEEEIRYYAAEKRDIVDSSAVLWNLLYSAIEHFQETRPDWIFVRLEDLSRNTLPAFRKLYEQLDLEWSEGVEKFIESTSSSRNLAVDSDPGSIRRDSAAHSWSWKKQLGPEEVARVRKITDPLWKRWYAPADWGD